MGRAFPQVSERYGSSVLRDALGWDFQFAVARAPLRIGVGGGGSDLPSYSSEFGGRVVNFAISKAVTTVAWLGEESTQSEAAEPHEFSGGPRRLEEGISQWFLRRGYLSARRLNLAMSSPFEPGSGLGASSALTVAALAAAGRLLGVAFSKTDLAKSAIEVERQICMIPGGIQDFFPAVSGGFRDVKNQGLTVLENKQLPAPRSFRAWLDESMYLVFAGEREEIGNLVEEQIKNGTNVATTDALHELKKLGELASEAITRGDRELFLECINRSWSLKGKLSEGTVSTSMTKLRDLLLSVGALGVKVSGAGGGGHLFAVVPRKKQRQFTDALDQLGCAHHKVGLRPEGVVTSLKKSIALRQ